MTFQVKPLLNIRIPYNFPKYLAFQVAWTAETIFTSDWCATFYHFVCQSIQSMYWLRGTALSVDDNRRFANNANNTFGPNVLVTIATQKKTYLIQGGGCSTAAEHTPADQNSWACRFESRRALLLSSVMCLCTGPSRRCSITVFPI